MTELNEREKRALKAIRDDEEEEILQLERFKCAIAIWKTNPFFLPLLAPLLKAYAKLVFLQEQLRLHEEDELELSEMLSYTTAKREEIYAKEVRPAATRLTRAFQAKGCNRAEIKF